MASKQQRRYRSCVKRLGSSKVARGKCLYKIYIKKSRKSKKSSSLSSCDCNV